MINENRKSIFITFAVFGFIILQFFIFSNAVQADIIGYTQVITLNPGWNIISTPRLVQSHQFSVAESVSNFDIYLLNASSTSGWATMQELGQSEFTPLYGYFINNKTGVNQSLILNYLQNVSPGNRLFTRQLSRGWNVIGVANPTYSLKQKTSDNIDTNNIQSILTTLATSAEVVLDFTADQTPLSSVKVGDTWKSEIFNDANSLNDFRDTKAYAVYLSSVSDYQGYQDNSPVDDGILPYGNMNLAATGNYGAQTVTAPQTAFKLGSFVLVGNSTEGVNLNLVTVGFTPTGNFTVSKLQNVYIAYNGTQTTARSLVPTASSTWSISVNLPASGTMSFDVYADIVSGFTSGSMRTDMTVNGITANSSQLVSSLDTAGQLITVDVGSITAGVDGSTPVSTLVKGGSAVDVAVYKFTTTNNAYNLNAATLSVAADGATAISGVNFYNETTLLNATPLPVVGTTISLSGGNIPIAANSSWRLRVQMILGSIGTGAGTGGADIKVTLTSFDATPSSGSKVTTNGLSLSGSDMYVYKAIPTIANQTLPTTVLSDGTETIAKFTVSGDGTVSWGRIIFKVSTSGASFSLPKLYDASSGNEILSSYSTSPTQIIVTPWNEEQISGSKSYVLRVQVTGTFTGGEYISTYIDKVAGFASSANLVTAEAANSSADTFVWSDQSSNGHATSTPDWTGENLVKTLPTDSWTLTK